MIYCSDLDLPVKDLFWVEVKSYEPGQSVNWSEESVRSMLKKIVIWSVWGGCSRAAGTIVLMRAGSAKCGEEQQGSTVDRNT